MARRRGLNPWIVATPLAAGVNLALLALLAQAPPMEDVDPGEPIVIAFEPPPRGERLRPRRRSGALPESDPIPALSGAAPGPVEGAPTAAAPQPRPAAQTEWQVDGGAWLDPARRGDAARLAALAGALRAQRDCTGPPAARRTADDRARCLAAWEAAAERVAAKGDPPLDLDPRRAYARPAEPYLQRLPKNGCKPRAGGTPVPAFGDQGVAAGVSCAFSF